MAYDAFLKIDGIDGESLESNHTGWIEVLSWSWGASQPSERMSVGSAGGGTAGKPSIAVFNMGKRVDKASPALFLRCVTGKHIPTVTLEVGTRSESEPALIYLHLKLTNVLVSSVRPTQLLTASSQSPVGQLPDSPVELVSFNYDKVVFEYDFPNPAGGVATPFTATYDVKAAKGA